jgi:alpha-L-fucosidase
MGNPVLKNEPIKWPFVVYLGLVVFSLTVCFTTTADAGNSKDPSDYLQAGEQDLQRWREMKFGLFIHWGPVSLKGTEIGWSRGGERRGLRIKRNPKGIPVDVYDNLYKSFYPAQFDAKQWVQIAKDAGMK